MDQVQACELGQQRGLGRADPAKGAHDVAGRVVGRAHQAGRAVPGQAAVGLVASRRHRSWSTQRTRVANCFGSRCGGGPMASSCRIARRLPRSAGGAEREVVGVLPRRRRRRRPSRPSPASRRDPAGGPPRTRRPSPRARTRRRTLRPNRSRRSSRRATVSPTIRSRLRSVRSFGSAVSDRSRAGPSRRP